MLRRSGSMGPTSQFLVGGPKRTNSLESTVDARDDIRRNPGLFWVGSRVEPMLHGEERQFEAVRNAQLVEDVREVVLHGLDADGIFLRDVGVRVAADDRRYDLQLARR